MNRIGPYPLLFRLFPWFLAMSLAGVAELESACFDSGLGATDRSLDKLSQLVAP